MGKFRASQKGHGIVFMVLMGIFVLFCLLVVFQTVSNTNDQTKNKSAGTTKQTTTVSPVTPSPYTTTSWAGYLKSASTNSPMSGVSAEWNVPSVTLAQTPELSSDWIGIGGYKNVATKGLIQTGTDSDTGLLDNGVRVNHYSAFWECVPNPSEHISDLTINGGDAMQSSITKNGANWDVVLTDKTTGQTFQKTTPCDPDLTTAEWILENVQMPVPGQASIQGTLPQLSTTTFKNLTVNGKVPGRDNQILFKITQDGTPSGKLIAAPSDLNTNGTEFTIGNAK